MTVSATTLPPELRLTHLRQLEAEAVHIMREVVAQLERPVMLYSIGKDSSVLLHLARKAFFPGRLPFPLLHVDTTWKFREMIEFRDRTAAELDIDLIVHSNPEGVAAGINPFDHGSKNYTDIMKTTALKQALEAGHFDAAFGGARRDEEKSRAKERIFSFRDRLHRWDPKNQRPELWDIYNGRVDRGESIRVFPISNWTELDVWQYIHLEEIPIVPLYDWSDSCSVQRDNGDLLEVDVLPHVEFSPVADRKDSDALTVVDPAVVEVPEFGSLVFRVPAVVAVPKAEDSLLGPGPLLVPAGPAECGVVSAGV